MQTLIELNFCNFRKQSILLKLQTKKSLNQWHASIVMNGTRGTTNIETALNQTHSPQILFHSIFQITAAARVRCRPPLWVGRHNVANDWCDAAQTRSRQTGWVETGWNNDALTVQSSRNYRPLSLPFRNKLSNEKWSFPRHTRGCNLVMLIEMG